MPISRLWSKQFAEWYRPHALCRNFCQKHNSPQQRVLDLYARCTRNRVGSCPHDLTSTTADQEFDKASRVNLADRERCWNIRWLILKCTNLYSRLLYLSFEDITLTSTWKSENLWILAQRGVSSTNRLLNLNIRFINLLSVYYSVNWLNIHKVNPLQYKNFRIGLQNRANTLVTELLIS